MRRALLFLAAAVVLAGCTSLPAGQTERGEGIEVSASLADDTVFSDDTTSLVLEIRNHNPQPLSDLDIRFGNANNLVIERQSCRMVEERQVKGAGFGVAATRSCVWDIAPADGLNAPASNDEFRIPLTVFVSYTTEMIPRDVSVKVRFKRQEDISPGGEAVPESLQATNGDISLRTSHVSPVSADGGDVPIALEVANTGSGRLQSLKSEEDTEEVEVSYEGSFMRIGGEGLGFLNSEATTCLDGTGGTLSDVKTLSFLEGRTRSAVDCQFALTSSALEQNQLAERTFSLRPAVRYRYRRVDNTPLTVVFQ